MDLTGKSDTQNKTHNIFGIVDHGSRADLCLVGLKDKASITLLRHLLDTIERYGKPKVIRTDNESCFTSKLFCFGLWLLGIKHQRIDRGCPWMNGRIERFFGSLKEKLNLWEVDNRNQLNSALRQFQVWYNHVRPHQHLDGRTPAEVWQGTNIYTQHIKKEYWFEVWDGLLTGYYLRL
jgi:transposase InsO family protein